MGSEGGKLGPYEDPEVDAAIHIVTLDVRRQMSRGKFESHPKVAFRCQNRERSNGLCVNGRASPETAR